MKEGQQAAAAELLANLAHSALSVACNALVQLVDQASRVPILT